MHATPVNGTRSPSTGRSRFVVAAIAALVGLVWVLQGVGVLPGSFMTGDILWTWIGLALIGAAFAYAFWPRLHRRG
jgi:hypothetical protein